MRLYSVGITSLVVQAPLKWTDNLLSQHAIPDVTRRQRGVARGVSWDALVRIALIRELHVRLGCGVREAVDLATALIASSPLTIDPAGTLSMWIDRPAFERVLQARLTDALESAPRPTRGRPRRRFARDA